MTTIKNIEVKMALIGLGKLAALSIPIALSMKIRKTVRLLHVESEDIEKERRAIIDKYALRDTDDNWLIDGSNVRFVDAAAERKCELEIEELGDLPTCELPSISLEDFGPKYSDASRDDYIEPEGLAAIFILLGGLFDD
jgi:hypothetical protein